MRQAGQNAGGFVEQGLTGQAAHLITVLGCQTVTRQGGVGGNDPVDACGAGDLGHVFQAVVIQIRGDLQEDRNAAFQPVAGVQHAAQQGCQGILALQIAQLFGVGRTDVDRRKIKVGAAAGQHSREIGGAVFAVFVRT